MTEAAETELLQRVWDYPLFAALYGRRSRRFGLGFEIAEGPFRYRSRHAALPLDEFEEGLLVAAGPGGRVRARSWRRRCWPPPAPASGAFRWGTAAGPPPAATATAAPSAA